LKVALDRKKGDAEIKIWTKVYKINRRKEAYLKASAEVAMLNNHC
jgi:hypothetical protein